MYNYKIRYAQQAVDDMDAIFDYIALENKDAAMEFLTSFDKSISRLKESPFLGAAISTQETTIIADGYRYLVVSPYMIFYRIKNNEVWIGRVLHSHQDWLQLLFGRK